MVVGVGEIGLLVEVVGGSVFVGWTAGENGGVRVGLIATEVYGASARDIDKEPRTRTLVKRTIKSR